VVAAADDFLAPGTMLGDYRIEGKLGEGGWGSVFSAVHPLIGKRTAIKVLKKELCQKPAAVKRFIDEARAVNEIGHPNIVDVFTFGETRDGYSYFVMEWLKGETLFRRTRKGRLSLDEICAIVKPLTRALSAANEKGIIHRDLKPENVFLVDVRDEPFRVKLLDFGIAKLANNRLPADRTSTGQIIGTPIYMAPEQARGGPIDHNVDIYALGGMLFELLTGRTPFVADNAADLIVSHLTETPPHPSAFAKNVPPALDKLVFAMLAKNPTNRPAMRHVYSVLDKVHDEAHASQRALTEGHSTAHAKLLLASIRSACARGAHAAIQRVRTHNPHAWSIAGAALATIVVLLIVRGVTRDSGRAQPAALPTGQVILSVSGARSFEVLVDDHPTIPAPGGTISLLPGVHTIQVRAPGMSKESFRVDIAAGSVLRESVDLERQDASAPRGR
jgi:tRNA A-37 threonylcarbamoyl transferase component Bud32